MVSVETTNKAIYGWTLPLLLGLASCSHQKPEVPALPRQNFSQALQLQPDRISPENFAQYFGDALIVPLTQKRIHVLSYRMENGKAMLDGEREGICVAAYPLTNKDLVDSAMIRFTMIVEEQIQRRGLEHIVRCDDFERSQTIGAKVSDNVALHYQRAQEVERFWIGSAYVPSQVTLLDRFAAYSIPITQEILVISGKDKGGVERCILIGADDRITRAAAGRYIWKKSVD